MNDIYNNIGGSLESAIAGRYDFKIRAIIKEAWHKTKGIKGTYWKALFLLFLVIIGIFLVTFAIAFLTGIVMGLAGANDNVIDAAGKIVGVVCQFISLVITAPLSVGLLMIGIRWSVDEPSQAKSIFHYYHYWRRLWVIPILLSFISLIGEGANTVLVHLGYEESFFSFITALIFAVLFIYVLISYLLFAPLVAEKHLPIGAAMSAARKGTGHHWWKVLGLLIVMGIILALSAIPLGLGLIWTLPMMNNTLGILYREIYGVQKTAL